MATENVVELKLRLAEEALGRERQRAGQAESAVARARHVCHKAMAEPDAPGQWLVAQKVLAAIDAQEETNAGH